MRQTRDTGLLPESDLMARAGGRMPYEMAGDDANYPIARILTTADLVGRGKGKIPQLESALSDRDGAVRFWGATGLAALGLAAKPASDHLVAALQDQQSSVRFAAAEALCNIGRERQALPVLIAGLQNGNIYEQLHAAETLVVIDAKARPAIAEMKAAIKRAEGLQDHGWYLREALSFLVNKLEA